MQVSGPREPGMDIPALGRQPVEVQTKQQNLEEMNIEWLSTYLDFHIKPCLGFTENGLKMGHSNRRPH